MRDIAKKRARGQATRLKYERSRVARERSRRYDASPKGRERCARYDRSEKGRARAARYYWLTRRKRDLAAQREAARGALAQIEQQIEEEIRRLLQTGAVKSVDSERRADV